MGRLRSKFTDLTSQPPKAQGQYIQQSVLRNRRVESGPFSPCISTSGSVVCGLSIVSPEQKLGTVQQLLGSLWGLIFGARKRSSDLLIKISGLYPSQAHDKGIKEGLLAHRPLT